MKKFLIVAAMIAASVTLSAQQKGDFTVGGALGVGGGSITNKWSTTAGGQTNSEKETYPSTTNFTLAPTFSYFVIDNLELSAGLQYDMTRSYNGKSSDNKNRFGFQHIAMGIIGAHYYIPLIEEALQYPRIMMAAKPQIKCRLFSLSTQTSARSNSRLQTTSVSLQIY